MVSYIYIEREMPYKIQYNEDDNVYCMPGILLDTLHVFNSSHNLVLSFFFLVFSCIFFLIEV